MKTLRDYYNCTLLNLLENRGAAAMNFYVLKERVYDVAERCSVARVVPGCRQDKG
jgi:hypothetical protein